MHAPPTKYFIVYMYLKVMNGNINILYTMYKSNLNRTEAFYWGVLQVYIEKIPKIYTCIKGWTITKN